MTHLKRTTQAVCASALIALIAGCSDNSSVPVAISDSSAGAKSAQEDSGLPQNIIDAVNEAKPGGTIVAATIEKEDGKTVYEVKVEADGQLWEVEVSAKGKVLEIELDDGDGEGNEGAEAIRTRGMRTPTRTMTGKRAMMTTTMTARGKKMPTGTPAPVKVEQSK